MPSGALVSNTGGGSTNPRDGAVDVVVKLVAEVLGVVMGHLVVRSS